MNIFQKMVYRLFRVVMNPYFNKHPGAMIPVMFGFQDSLKKAGFTDEELSMLRVEFDKLKEKYANKQ